MKTVHASLAIRRSVIRLSLMLVMLGTLIQASGCSTSDSEQEPGARSPSANLDPNVAPVTQGAWYRPGIDVTWQWQLQGPVNTAYDVDLYDIDLFEATDEVIRTLHARGDKILCYFSAGSAENFRPDFAQFLDTDLGRTLEGFDDERWVDIRSQNVVEIMEARLDLAVQRGCDGVEPDNVIAYQSQTGFEQTASDQLAFNRHLANAAHQRNLAVALKNDGDQANDLVDYFDLELNEQCHQFAECDPLLVFLQRGKPVLNAEYVGSAADAQSLSATLCPIANQERLSTLILPVDLDDSFRVSCR